MHWRRSVFNIGEARRLTIERPKAARGRGLGRGCSLPSGEGSGEGLCPSPEKFWFLICINGAFLCIFLGTEVERSCNINIYHYSTVTYVGSVDWAHCNNHLARHVTSILFVILKGTLCLFFHFLSLSFLCTLPLSHLPSYPLPFSPPTSPFSSPSASIFNCRIAVGELQCIFWIRVLLLCGGFRKLKKLEIT